MTSALSGIRTAQAEPPKTRGDETTAFERGTGGAIPIVGGGVVGMFGAGILASGQRSRDSDTQLMTWADYSRDTARGAESSNARSRFDSVGTLRYRLDAGHRNRAQLEKDLAAISRKYDDPHNGNPLLAKRFNPTERFGHTMEALDFDKGVRAAAGAVLADGRTRTYMGRAPASAAEAVASAQRVIAGPMPFVAAVGSVSPGNGPAAVTRLVATGVGSPATKSLPQSDLTAKSMHATTAYLQRGDWYVPLEVRLDGVPEGRRPLNMPAITAPDVKIPATMTFKGSLPTKSGELPTALIHEMGTIDDGLRTFQAMKLTGTQAPNFRGNVAATILIAGGLAGAVLGAGAILRSQQD